MSILDNLFKLTRMKHVLLDDEVKKELDNLYGKRNSPYYIYSPRWIETSAGIKALHFLCHSLNAVGERAYLIFTEAVHGNEPRISGELNTPILTQEVLDAHKKADLVPIVIYSETIPGNPIKATCIVRYLMNYAGALGGPSSFDENEMLISFSNSIARNYATQNGIQPKVLFLPPIDPRPFIEIQEQEKKPFQLTYAGKYRAFIGKPPKVGNLPNIEIHREGPKKQARTEVIELLKKATVLYAFENSSIITEATLSGTPTVIVKNEFFQEIIAEDELSLAGTTFEDSKEGIESAKISTKDGQDAYFWAIHSFYQNLALFIAESQEFSKNFSGEQVQITIPHYKYLINRHRLSIGIEILKNQGLLSLFLVIKNFIRRRLKYKYWKTILQKKGAK